MEDITEGLQTVYTVNSEGYRTHLLVTDSGGNVVRQTSCQLNALNQETLLYDGPFIAELAYDAGLNIRSILAQIPGIAGRASWYRYDAEERFLVFDGSLVNGSIQITSTQGTLYGYGGGLRLQGAYGGGHHDYIWTDDSYLSMINGFSDYWDNGQIKEYQSLWLKYDWELNQLVGYHEKTYSLNTFTGQTSLSKYLDEALSFNANSQQIGDSQRTCTIDQDEYQIATTYAINPLTQWTDSQQVVIQDVSTGDVTVDDYELIPVKFGTRKLSAILGTRQNPYGSSTAASNLYYNANGQLGGNEHPISEDSEVTNVFTQTTDGMVVSRLTQASGAFWFESGYSFSYYLHSLNTQALLASYQWLDSNGNIAPDFEMLPMYAKRPDGNGPLPMVQNYQIQAGDTWESIAQRIYGDSRYGAQVALLNGQSPTDTPPVGQMLQLKPLLASHLVSGNGVSLDIFLNTVMGQLSPYLRTPQPHHHHHWWQTLVEMLVGVMVAIVAPQFLGYFGMFAEVIAGVFSQLAVEGVALALHDSNRLHWKSLIENVVANLATLGLSRIEGVPLLTLNAKGVMASQSMKSLVQSDALVKSFFAGFSLGVQSHIVMQLTSLGLGFRKKFNWEEVFAAGLNGGAQEVTARVLGNKGWLERSVLTSTVTQMTGSFVGVGLAHEHFNAETLAATIVGEALGQVAGTKLASEVKQWQDASLAAHPKAHVSATPTPSASPKPHHSSHPGFFKKPSPDALQTQARQAEDWFKKWEFGQNIDQEIEEALAPHFDGGTQVFPHSSLSSNNFHTVWKGLTSPLLMETVLETLPFEERVMFNLETSLASSLVLPEVALTGAIGLMGRTVEMAVSASQSVWTKGLRFFGGGAESSRLISSITRISSNAANEPFISEEAITAGWKPPYPADIDVRELTLSQETRFARVFTGEDPAGQFLVRYKEIAHIIDNPEAIRIHLGLREVPTNIADVYVPANTKLLVGRIGEQPNFGLMSRSGFQYQLEEWIPPSSFRNIRSLQQELNNNSYLNFRK